MSLGFKLHCLDSLELRLVYSPLRFLHHNLLGCFRLPTPRLSLSPDPEPGIFLVRIVPFIPLSYVQDRFWYCFYVQNLHRNTNTQSILVLLLEQVRTWAERGPSARRGDKPRSINCFLLCILFTLLLLFTLLALFTVLTLFTLFTLLALLALLSLLYWTVLGNTGFCWSVLDSAGLFWTLLGCIDCTDLC